MNIFDQYKTKNATFFTRGTNGITAEMIRSIEGVESVDSFTTEDDKPEGFRISLSNCSFSIFNNADADKLAETKSGFVGWIERINRDKPKADVRGLLLHIKEANGMYGVVADNEFTISENIFEVLGEITKRSEAILLVFNSVMNAKGEFEVGQFWEIGQELLPKPWWKFWA